MARSRLPRLMLENLRHSSARYSVLSRKLGDLPVASCSAVANLRDLLGRKFRPSVSVSSVVRPASRDDVLHVLRVGACVEMIRVDAERVIAVMADLKPIRNRTDQKFVGEAVGSDLVGGSVWTIRSVPYASILMRLTSSPAPRPGPTLILGSPVGLCPESLLGCEL